MNNYVSLVSSYWRTYQPTWAKLSRFGGSSMAKMAWVLPIIAQAVRGAEEFILNTLNLYNVLWLYWSLVSISIGQLLYWLYCPRDINKYGDDQERYKIEKLATMHSGSFEGLFDQMVSGAYINSIGSASNKFVYDYTNRLITPRFNIPSHEDDAMNFSIISSDYADFPSIEMSVFRMQTTKHLVENYKVTDVLDSYKGFLQAVRSGIAIPSINWNIINDLVSHRAELFGLHSSERLPYISQRIYGDDRNWKTLSLSWAYDVNNLRFPKVRYFITAFYGLAIPYFIYVVVRNLIAMVQLSWGAALTLFP